MRTGGRLHTCEDLISGWKSIVYPKEAVGNRAYAFHGALANIENALMIFARNIVCEEHPDAEYVEVDDVLPLATTHACGFPLPDQTERMLQYTLLDDETKCLSGTAEMGIADRLRDLVFDLDDLPVVYVAKSRCFRPEISTTSAEAKLYRVHEFTKMEMFWVCAPGQGEEALERITSTQTRINEELGLHFRLVDMPPEELGASASRKVDIEAWMPGRGLFGEVSSASFCADYQSSRLNIRYRTREGSLEHVHTLNGTVLAATRTLIALLETHQEEGRKGVNIPSVLRPFLPPHRSPPVHLGRAPPIDYSASV
ncbi:Seryl-tRNA synthetase [Aphelenchoides fujianensis]|nr:Seryl-tRNA synthetase [Aphelenchoides fujianensis]